MREGNKFWKFILVIESVVLDVGLDTSLDGSDKVGGNAVGKGEGLIEENSKVSHCNNLLFCWKYELSSQGLCVNKCLDFE